MKIDIKGGNGTREPLDSWLDVGDKLDEVDIWTCLSFEVSKA